MPRSLLCLGFLLVSLPVCAQTSSTDSETLRALLAEVRQLRVDMQTTTLAALRAQILLHRLLAQEAVVARATQRLDEARKGLTELQTTNKWEVAEIKRVENFVNNPDIPSAERKRLEDSLPERKSRLESAQAQEQELQARTIEAEEQQRTEQAKLDGLQYQLDRLEKALDKPAL